MTGNFTCEKKISEYLTGYRSLFTLKLIVIALVNFKAKGTAAASRGFLAVTRFSCRCRRRQEKKKEKKGKGRYHKVTRRYISASCGVDAPGPISLKFSLRIIAPHDVITFTSLLLRLD